MATLDEIFASMPDEAAGGTHELLIIDPDTRQIYVPDSESIFGVEFDGNAETKYFQCPRYVGKGIDLAACFLRINYQNANGDRDGYLVKDTTINGDNIYFSWELSPKVTQYKGGVQFVLCASLPGSNKTNDWHTTLAQGDVLQGLEPDAAVVEKECSDLIAQLLALVSAQSDNVETVGAAQVAAVEAVGAEQVLTVEDAAKAAQEAAVAEIEAKKQNALADLPEDYTAMDAQVEKLTRNTAGAIICEAAGEAIQVADASDNYLHSLRIFGKSTQDGTPTPDAPVEIVSTPAPVVAVCGKNLAEGMENLGFASVSAETVLLNTNKEYRALVARVTPGEVYTVSRGAALGSRFRYGFTKAYPVSGMTVDPPATTMAGTYDTALQFTTVPVPAGYYYLVVYLTNSNSAETVENTWYQVEPGATATKYEPYTGQTLTLANSLPGIPVTSGGNYTDADGQQWICDEVDLGRGVYVQRTKKVRLENMALYDEVKRNFQKTLATDMVNNYNVEQSQGRSYVTHYAYNEGVWTGTSLENGYVFNYRGIFVRDLNYTSLDDFNAYLAENEVYVLYELATPIETPLTEAELAAFAALRSNKPTTTILNDAGAWMAAEYVADTKLYIDQKLAALVAANNT